MVETGANWRVYSASEEDSNSQLSRPVAPDIAIFPKHRATWIFGKLAEVLKHCFDLKKKPAASGTHLYAEPYSWAMLATSCLKAPEIARVFSESFNKSLLCL